MDSKGRKKDSESGLSLNDEINYSERMNKAREIIDITERESSKIVDTNTYISETQARVWKALKTGLQFEATLDKSERYLHKHVNTRKNFVVLVADLVGSTKMTRTLPIDRLATIIQTFSQEMSYAIFNFEGLVLKYVGDAIIAYFPADTNFYMASDTAVNCANSMITILQQGINPILNQYDYPELKIKIGIDVGVHAVIQYGAGDRSHVDILGYGISMAAKISSLAQPDQIVVSESIYKGMHPSMRTRFSELPLDPSWTYIDENTGDVYRLYASKG
ncbi:MAG: adenylate/guanylate cyclase domain-containing protein [Nitrososphaerales archaeon]